MTFTTDAAGVLAQILAVLLLAAIFDPAYRGMAASKLIVDPETGRRHRVPTHGRAIRIVSGYRLCAFGFTLFAIVVDAWFVAYGTDLSGLFANLVIVLNLMTLAAVATYVFLVAIQHATDDKQDGKDQSGDKSA